jgi:hypothetical protein
MFYEQFIQFWSRVFNLAASSFYSPEFYRRVVWNFKGYGFQYLAVICFLITVSASIFFIKSYNELSSYFKTGEPNSYLAETLDYYLTALPEMSWDGEKLSKEGKEEVIIKSESGKDIIVIDLNNKLSPTNKSNYFIAITPTHLEFPGKGIELNLSLFLGSKPIETISKPNALNNFNNDLSPGFLIFMNSALLFWLWSSNAFYALVFGAILVFIDSFFSPGRLDIKSAARLCCYSATPALLVESLIYLILSLSLYNLALIFGVIYQVFAYAYVVFAYISISHNSSEKMID